MLSRLCYKPQAHLKPFSRIREGRNGLYVTPLRAATACEANVFSSAMLTSRCLQRSDSFSAIFWRGGGTDRVVTSVCFFVLFSVSNDEVRSSNVTFACILHVPYFRSQHPPLPVDNRYCSFKNIVENDPLSLRMRETLYVLYAITWTGK